MTFVGQESPGINPDLGLFTQYQPAYAEHGISAIPCSTDFKKPMVSNYLNIGIGGSKALADKFTTSNAIGIVTGRRNHITVLDVDTTDQRVLDDALGRHGDARIVVRTASGKFHAYYRHNGESRKIRPWPERPIDLLGERGFVMAPPSHYGPGQYEIIHGSFDDLAHLTTMRGVDVVEKTAERKSEPSPTNEGRRNDDLWRHCMKHARSCSTRDELIDIARGENEMYHPPLEQAEVVKIAQSAWAYTETGQNFIGQPAARLTTDEILPLMPDAEVGMLYLWAKTMNKPTAEFWLADGLAAKFGWSLYQFRQTRHRATEAGLFRRVRGGTTGHPALYVFGKGTKRGRRARGAV